MTDDQRCPECGHKICKCDELEEKQLLHEKIIFNMKLDGFDFSVMNKGGILKSHEVKEIMKLQEEYFKRKGFIND